jgi:hypothetical protein
MNDKTGGNRGLRRAGTLAVVAAVAVLATGCGMVHVHAGSSGGSAPAGSATFRENLAFAHCMQTHGVPNFPTPKNSSQGFHISGHVNGNGFSGPSGRAYDACKQLLPPDSVTASSGHSDAGRSRPGLEGRPVPAHSRCAELPRPHSGRRKCAFQR